MKETLCILSAASSREESVYKNDKKANQSKGRGKRKYEEWVCTQSWPLDIFHRVIDSGGKCWAM